MYCKDCENVKFKTELINIFEKFREAKTQINPIFSMQLKLNLRISAIF